MPPKKNLKSSFPPAEPGEFRSDIFKQTPHMKPLPITQFGNPILRNGASVVNVRFLATKQFRELTRAMLFTMRKVGGVGIAAPQVGKSIQLTVVEIKKSKVRPDTRPFPVSVIVNPKITKRSKEIISDWEGCFSLPDVRGLVPRHKSVEVHYYDAYGKRRIKKLTGLQARVFQHEIDHLNGILYVDRIKDMKTLMTLEEFKKRILQKGLKSK